MSLGHAESKPAQSPGGHRPVDIAHLERATFGDRALLQDVLTLFVEQARELAQAIVRAPNAAARRAAAHKLKGAARGIGAFAVANAAETVERTEPAFLPDAIALLQSRVIEAQQAVAEIIERD